MNPWGSGEKPKPAMQLNPRPDPRRHLADFRYKPPGPVARDFLLSDAFVRGIRGPVGSGKSTLCCAEIMRRASQQRPSADGIRRTRWVVVRNTQPELRTTTIKTWVQTFPEHRWGRFRWSSPFTHHIKKGDIDLEVIFLALDNPDDVKKLLSLEVTGGWANEARELPKAIIDGLTMRCGRYPPVTDGSGGASWYGAIMDTNAPDVDHWWPILSGEAPIPDYIPYEERLLLQKPDNWEFFTQPAGMIETVVNGELRGYEVNPAAENVGNLVDGYYRNMVGGKTRSWIDIYVMNRLGHEQDGKPIYQTFASGVHVSHETLPFDPLLPMFVGLDFGLSPAAVFAQRTIDGQIRILRELVGTDMGIARFGRLMTETLVGWYDRSRWRDKVSVFGDPAGDQRAQTDEMTPFRILAGLGLAASPASTNDFTVRVETVNRIFSELVVGGRPRILIDPGCSMLLRACEGGYRFRKLKVGGEPRYEERPDKNRFSHVAEALQYLVLGLGEGRETLRSALTPATSRGRASQLGGILERRRVRQPLARRERRSLV